MEKTQVLVCGATGFIGRNMIEHFAQNESLEVTGTYFQTEPDDRLAKLPASLSQVDLTKRAEVEDIVKGKDIIIQSAAVTSGSKDIKERPYLHVADNAVMNSLIFRSAFEQKVRQVVFFSCSVMYPNQEVPVKEEDFNYQISSDYFGVGWTKVYLEKMCEFYSRLGSTKFTAIRHSNIYGPYDKYDLDHSHFFGATVTKIMTNQDGKIVVWGDGSEKKDLLHVCDLVSFVERVTKMQQDPFELINIGSGTSLPVRELVSKTIEISGRKIEMDFDSSKPTIKFDLALNAQKAKIKYDWQPNLALDEGIRNTLLWYQENILEEGK